MTVVRNALEWNDHSKALRLACTQKPHTPLRPTAGFSLMHAIIKYALKRIRYISLHMALNNKKC
jgi:hypothetical protein